MFYFQRIHSFIIPVCTHPCFTFCNFHWCKQIKWCSSFFFIPSLRIYIFFNFSLTGFIRHMFTRARTWNKFRRRNSGRQHWPPDEPGIKENCVFLQVCFLTMSFHVIYSNKTSSVRFLLCVFYVLWVSASAASEWERTDLPAAVSHCLVQESTDEEDTSQSSMRQHKAADWM